MRSEFPQWQARDVMSDPVTIGPDTTIAEAEALLEREGFNAVPVVDAGGALMGFVTSLDLLAAFDFEEDAILPSFERVMDRPVSGIMSRDLVTVTPRTPLPRVLSKLVAGRRKSLPVLDDDRLVGVVTRADVMNALRRAGGGEPPPAQRGGP